MHFNPMPILYGLFQWGGGRQTRQTPPTFDISNLDFCSKRINCLKYLRSMTLESKDLGIRKYEFVEKTQFLLN